MSNTSGDTYTAPWKKMADSWSFFTPPWHPSPENITVFKQMLEKTIQSIEAPRVLILGATPEIRDMFAGYPQCEVVLADITIEMILAMNELVTRENFSREVWVKSNWLTMPLERNSFDFIIGDYVVSQFPPNLVPVFFLKMRSLLKESGTLVLRTVYFNAQAALSFDEIMQKFSNQPENNQAVTDIASYCFVGKDIVKNGNEYTFSLPHLKTVIDNFQKRRGDSPWISILHKALSPYEKEWFFFDLPRTEVVFEESFTIEEKALEPEWSSLKDNSFIFCLAPR